MDNEEVVIELEMTVENLMCAFGISEREAQHAIAMDLGQSEGDCVGYDPGGIPNEFR